MPPFFRKPPESTPVTSIVVVACGGSVSNPKLSTNTSKLRPKPARIEVLPLVPGEYARPTRGIQAFFLAVGFWNSIRPGTLEIALRVCSVSL